MRTTLSSITIAIFFLGLGCKSSPETTAPASTSAASAPAMSPGKVTAPVTVVLSAIEDGDRTRVTMDLAATADIPRGVARFVVPDGINVVSGATEVALGALTKGEARQLEVVFAASEVGYRVAGGVDAFMSESVRLHAGASIDVGDVGEPSSTTKVMKAPGARDGIRVEEVQPKR